MMGSKPTKAMLSVSCLAAGIGLFWLVFHFFPGTIVAIRSAVHEISLFWAFLVLAATFANILLTAAKWNVITKELTNRSFSIWWFSFYVAMSALVGQLALTQVGVVGVRSLALKHHGIASLGRGMTTVLYDLFFDLLIPLWLLFPSIILLLGKISIGQAVALSATLLTFAFLTTGKLHIVVSRLAGTVWARRKPPLESMAQLIPSVSPKLARKMLFLALVRYGNLILRSIFVAKTINLPISISTICVVFPLVQLAFLASFTPAGLGITEWSWIAVLSLLQIPASVAVMFAVLHRILVLISLLLIAVGLSWQRISEPRLAGGSR